MLVLSFLFFGVSFAASPEMFQVGSTVPSDIYSGTDPFPDAFATILRGLRISALLVYLFYGLPITLLGRRRQKRPDRDSEQLATTNIQLRHVAKLNGLLALIMLVTLGVELSIYGILPPVLFVILCHPLFWIAAIIAALATAWLIWGTGCTISHTVVDTSTKAGVGIVTLNLNLVFTAASSATHAFPPNATIIWDIWYTTSGNPLTAVFFGQAQSLRSPIVPGTSFTMTRGTGTVSFTGTLNPGATGGLRMQAGDSVVIRAASIDVNNDAGTTDYVITL
jgi:hypothetical protein